MKTIAQALLIALTVLFLSNCKKDKTIVIDNQTTSTKDNSIADKLFADVKKVVEEAADDEGQSGKMSSINAYSFGTCATVTTVPAWGDTTWPKVMTIDFGSTNCMGTNGTNRRGQLLVTLSDRYRNSGSVLTVQPQNYYVNDVKIEGTKTLTNNGYNTNNHLVFGVKVVNGKITYTDGTYATWASTRSNEWIEGDSTTLFTDGIAGICDDVYLVTGSANGVNRNGLSYTVSITSSLRVQVCCRWIVSGILEINPTDLATRVVDFGAGTCDNQASVTINGNVYNVIMW